MRVIGQLKLEKFMKKHSRSVTPLSIWLDEALNCNWTKPSDIKDRYRSADFLSNNRVIFNIGGNNFRLVVLIRYQNGIVVIDRVGTHAEYSKWELK